MAKLGKSKSGVFCSIKFTNVDSIKSAVVKNVSTIHFSFKSSYKKLLNKLLFLQFGKLNEFKVQTPKHTSNLTESLTLRSEVPFKTMKMNV
jgi:hypothetical protein